MSIGSEPLQIPSLTLRDVTVEIRSYSWSTKSLKSEISRLGLGGSVEREGPRSVSVRALSQINLDIRRGERVGILGPNGSGKSTLLRVLNGVYTPRRGQFSSRGKVNSLVDVSLGFDSEASGLQNIFLKGALLGLSRREIRSVVKEVIDFSDLGSFIHMPVNTYSTGMNLRLAFSIATLVKSDILLMDEWLSVGDIFFQRRAEERIEKLLSSTEILVLASHNLELVRELCNRAIVMNKGKIVFDGNPDEAIQIYVSGLHES